MMNVSIVTARTGSQSIKKKNLYEINGRPLLTYPIRASLNSEIVDECYVSTDGEDIAEAGQNAGAKILARPPHLIGDSAHGDVIRDAVNQVSNIYKKEIETITILLGNSLMVDSELIELCINSVIESDADSAMTVWKAEDDHPMRALKINEEGYLRYSTKKYQAENTNRQNYPDIFYYDNGPWVFEPHCVQNKDGVGPWWWMGDNCVAVQREWVTGRDIHDTFDVEFQKFYDTNRSKLINLEKRKLLK